MNTKQILFNIDQARLEARRPCGEVIKALEIFERTVREEPEPLAVVRTIGWRKPHGQVFITADTEHIHLGEAGSKSTLDELVNVTVTVLEGWHPPLTPDELAYVDATLLGAWFQPAEESHEQV